MAFFTTNYWDNLRTHYFPCMLIFFSCKNYLNVKSFMEFLRKSYFLGKSPIYTPVGTALVEDFKSA